MFETTKPLAAVGALLISSLSLLGWWVDHATLAEWLPAIADMTFNTATCFLLVALTCFQTGQWIRLVVGAIVGLFAIVSLSQDFFAVSFGIDNLLFDSHGYGLTSPYPGRMSPNTAAGFLISGAILITLAIQKKTNHFAAFAHTLVLLLVLVSFLGIGMNVLIEDVPGQFAHFASISLFTAISFLLLATAFMGIFQQQNKTEDAHGLLYSGIKLMYRLKYSRKFALISMVMAIPLAVLMWNELSLQEKEVAQARLKIIGIEHIQRDVRLIKAVPEHRGMLNAHLADAGVFSGAMRRKTGEVDRLFEQTESVLSPGLENIHVSDEWQAIKQRWAVIKANQQNPVTLWRLHTEIIALLAKHLRDIGNATLLSYDDDPVIHNLVAAQLQILPRQFEQIGQLRGRGAGFLARNAITDEERLMLSALASQTLLLLQEAEQLISVALTHGGDAELRAMGQEYARRARDFLAVADSQLISGKAFTISAEDYFSEASRALAAGYAFSHGSLQFAQHALEQRIASSITSQYTIKLSAMLVILLMVYLFAAFYQSVMSTIRALDVAAERMRKGEVNELAALPTHDELGDVVGSFNSIAGELMRVSSNMRAVVDHAVDGIITIDAEGIIKSFNPAAESIFGYAQNEVIGQGVTMLMPEQYREKHRCGMQHYQQTGKGSVVGAQRPVEVKGLRKDGAEFPLELSINVMLMEGRQLFIGMLRDVTEHQKLEHQLRHAQKMEAVGALVGGVAHNFNNLLAGIVGKVYLTKVKLQDRPEVLPHLESIEEISFQAGDMVKQLLTFAHKDFFSEKQDTSLNMLIKESFKTAKLGIEEDIELSLHNDGPDLVVHGDANQLQQVLMNMMNNARDAVADSAEKRIAVSLSACRPDAGFFRQHPKLKVGEYACLQIADSGQGMDADTVRRIFEPFFTSKEVGKGTGLGLSTAFGAITAHHGVIEVESEPGKGSTFRVFLPLVKEAASVRTAEAHDQVMRASGREVLLLVDDEQLVVDSIQGVLEALGYEVVTARDGVEGLERYKQHQGSIAAIVTDVTMPKMNGVEMFRNIRRINATVPAVFVTGYDQGNVLLLPGEEKNTIVLSKPVQVPELSQVVQNILADSTRPAGQLH